MMVDISNKKLNKKKSFFSKNKRVICDTHFLTLSKAGTFTSFSSQNKYAEISLFYKNNKRTFCSEATTNPAIKLGFNKF